VIVFGTAKELRSLRQAGGNAFPGFELVSLDTTPSTQDVVRDAARAGAAAGFTCLAAAQTSGRGRQGRRWSAPSGSALLGSVLVRPAAGGTGWVPLAAGLAMRSAIARLSGFEARLKWPNDIMAGPAKLAGVLCEVEPAAPGPGAAVVVGVGVNLHVEEFPAGVHGASLHDLSATPPRPAPLFGAFLGELRSRLDALAVAGGGGLRIEWLGHAAGLGHPVTAVSGAGVVEGVAEDIDLDGALVIRTRTGAVRVLAGDVHIGGGG
jgi:BirA family biotin operon repressor/biotin-[acetyl-CoA-carboxylase] ligase